MTAIEAQWSPVTHLILGDDPKRRVFADAAVWLKKIEVFRTREDERMILQEATPEDLAVHKTLLQRLIADGEHLLSLFRQLDLPTSPEGISSESLSATVELLRADYRGWHEPMPTHKRAHAYVAEWALLTRDPGRVRTYFPSVRLIRRLRCSPLLRALRTGRNYEPRTGSVGS
jgi:hypothetical protein